MTYSPVGSRAVAVRASLSTFAFVFVFLFSAFFLTLPDPARADDAPAIDPPPVAINLDIETATTTLFNGPLTVSGCLPNPSATASTTNALCAVEQSGVPVVWDWTYAPDAFLTSIGGVGNDYTNNVYWGWFSNLSYGQTALNKHVLTNGEHLLVVIGKQPLQLAVASTSPQVGTSTIITVTQFGLDASYNPVWTAATTSIVSVRDTTSGESWQIPTDASGTVSLIASSTDPLDISATEDGFVPTTHSTISPVPAPLAATTTATTTPDAATTTPDSPTPASSSSNGSNGGSGGGGGIIANTPTVDIGSATNYLLGTQQADGSWGSAMQSDWVAIGLVAANAPTTYQPNLLNYFAHDATFSNVTDYERHAMALEALGINPYTSGTIDHITSAFDGAKIGDPTLAAGSNTQVNSNIFAIFPLLAAGYTSNDTIIQKTIAFIVSQQSADGSWGNIDLTAAAVQALALVPNMPGAADALARARGYLLAHGDAQGCFGNTFSTAWALQAADALGTTSGTGASPQTTCLAAAQMADGSIGSTSDTTQTKIWATAYALPAARGLPWENILHTFPKPVTTGSNNAGAVATSTTSLATLVASSTAATSTAVTLPAPIITATSTATSTTPARSVAITTLAPTATTTLDTTPAPLTTKVGSKKMPSHNQTLGTNTQPAAVADAPATGSILTTLGHFVSSLWHAVAGLF